MLKGEPRGELLVKGEPRGELLVKGEPRGELPVKGGGEGFETSPSKPGKLRPFTFWRPGTEPERSLALFPWWKGCEQERGHIRKGTERERENKPLKLTLSFETWRKGSLKDKPKTRKKSE